MASSSGRWSSSSRTSSRPPVRTRLQAWARQLHACTSAAAEAAAQPPPLKRSHQQANSPSPEPPLPQPTSSSSNNGTLAIIQEVLKLAFKLYPRVVLSCCLQSFKGQDRVMFQVHILVASCLICAAGAN
eukprot:scaffold204988_cov19-Tisochrysis_lutea.AAC.1